jgi:hypothetical protein
MTHRKKTSSILLWYCALIHIFIMCLIAFRMFNLSPYTIAMVGMFASMMWFVVFVTYWWKYSIIHANSKFELWTPTCRECGYDMRSLPEGTACPECGGSVLPHPATLRPYHLMDGGDGIIRYRQK